MVENSWFYRGVRRYRFEFPWALLRDGPLYSVERDLSVAKLLLLFYFPLTQPLFTSATTTTPRANIHCIRFIHRTASTHSSSSPSPLLLIPTFPKTLLLLPQIYTYTHLYLYKLYMYTYRCKIYNIDD